MSQPHGTRDPRFIGMLGASIIVLVGGLATSFFFDSALAAVIATACALVAWIVPVLLTVRYRDRAKLLAMASKSDIKAVIEKIEETRAKESRHEYRQERALQRIEDNLRSVHVLSASGTDQGQKTGLDILFVTSNGAGLGHLSRLSAIAKHLPDDRSVEFLTMSTAYERMADSGFTVHYFPSGDAVGETPETWNPVFQRFFLGLVLRLRPRIVVFDGTWVYTGVTDVCRTFGIPLVWVQRGMWRHDVDENSVQRHNAKAVVDHVIIPGDFAGAESVDVGNGIDPHYVEPIVMTEFHEIVSREEACEALGLDPEDRYVLLSLGGGSISDPDSVAYETLELLKERASELKPVQVVSPLAKNSTDQIPGLIQVSAYPIMRFASAFDAMVAAAGYNSAQEAISMRLPSILVPNVNTITDDQSRRARLLAEQGLCWSVGDGTDLGQAVNRLADAEERRQMHGRLSAMHQSNGATKAAAIIDAIYHHSGWPGSATTLDLRRG